MGDPGVGDASPLAGPAGFAAAAVTLTRRCNLACAYCQTIRRPLAPELGPDEWRRVLPLLSDLGVRTVSFTGGEPTILPFLVELLEYARDAAGLRCMVATNCTFPPDEAEMYARAGVAGLIISIDALADGAVDEWSRAKSEAALAKLPLFRAAGIPRVIANVLVHRRNCSQIAETVRRLTGLGVESHPLVLHAAAAHHRPAPFAWQNRAPDDGLAFRPEDAPALARLSEALLRMKGEGAPVDASDAFLRALPTHATGLDWHCRPHPCKLRIDADGRLSCCQDVRGRRVSCFTVDDLADRERRETFLQAWAQDSQECPGCLYTDIFHAVEGREAAQ